MSELADAIERINGDLAAVGPDAGSVDTSTDALRTALAGLAEALDVAAVRGAALERVRGLGEDVDRLDAAAPDGVAVVGVQPAALLAALDGGAPHERP